jgi:hypothetical protein
MTGKLVVYHPLHDLFQLFQLFHMFFTFFAHVHVVALLFNFMMIGSIPDDCYIKRSTR